ncbi:MAG: orotate phosphoribosyltransferase [Candidatus Margulisbacteria bacterium GWF2_35_9]|nr:MAG: orotate phosphoribosyltransferase [Candidatus Margulisbacteria bacterium GWF2_35_9]
MIKELAKKIKDASYLEGDFILRSGKRSKYYLDKYLFETKYDILDQLTDAFKLKIEKNYPKFDILAAPELGAVAIVSLLSVKLKKNFVIIRKEQKDYGTAKQTEGSLEGVKSALLIEDILTTGGAALQSAKILRESGIDVIAIMGTIDRLQGGQAEIEKAGFKYDALLTVKDLGI